MSTPDLSRSSSELSTIAQISESVYAHVDEARDRFGTAEPFKHVVIEDFFENSFAERLLSDFPRFDPMLAKNEHGAIGRKAVNTKIREISPTYQELYATISSQPFLDLVSRLSGIPDLILDPKLYGGGTHENLHGQELDAHVDFNYDESQQLHRRLNLIVYLNKGWQMEWGGAIEIHSNPRRPKENQIKRYAPTFNRCVMFETNEYSWHGFPIINLPEDKRDQSRKSLSIYLYTKERPAHEVAPMHATFYVQRPLPERIQAGYTLSADDVKQLESLLERRDRWIENYHNQELKNNAEIANKNAYIRELTSHARVPLTGYIRQEGMAQGLYPDGWASPSVEFRVSPSEPVESLTLFGWRTESLPETATVQVSMDGEAPVEATVGHGEFELLIPIAQAKQESFAVRINTQTQSDDAALGGDDRQLAFVIAELRADHPRLKVEAAAETQAELTRLRNAAPAPTTGDAVQSGRATGFYWDGWLAPLAEVRLRPVKPIRIIELAGWRPENLAGTLAVSIFVNGELLKTESASADLFTISVELPAASSEVFDLRIASEPAFNPKATGTADDDRDLAFVLRELRVR